MNLPAIRKIPEQFVHCDDIIAGVDYIEEDTTVVTNVNNVLKYHELHCHTFVS